MEIIEICFKTLIMGTLGTALVIFCGMFWFRIITWVWDNIIKRKGAK